MTIEYLYLEKLRLSENNIRKTYNDEDIAELAQSIESVGLLQPLVVEHDPLDDTYEIVAGHRRFLALQKLGTFTTAPCSVVKLNSQVEALTTMLVENLQRVDITPLEEAAAYEVLRGSGMKQAQIAKQVGKSPAHVSKRLSLLKLPEWARENLASGKLSLDLAHRLTALDPIHVAVLKDKADKLSSYDIDNAERNQKWAKENAAIEAFLKDRTDVVTSWPKNATHVKTLSAANLDEAMLTDTMVLCRQGRVVHVYDTAVTENEDEWFDEDEDDEPGSNWWEQYQAASAKYQEDREAWITSTLKNPTPLAQMAALAMRYQLLDAWYEEVVEAAGLDDDEVTDERLVTYLKEGNNTLRLWTKYHLEGPELDEQLMAAGIVRPDRMSFMNADRIDPIEEDSHDDLGYEIDEAV